MTKRVVLVDGSSILYRAFFAMPHLIAPGGVPTGAIVGMVTMLFAIIEELEPQYIGVFFDRKAPTYRHELYKEYKGTREIMPDELVTQLVMVKDLIRSLGIVTREKDGYEADDFIGVYSTVARQASVPCIIYSGDNDLLQLADENTSVRITVKGVKQIREYTPQTIRTEFGLSAQQLAHVKALMGDHSDNIPGVPGIGEKTALRLIQEFGSVQALLEHGGSDRYRTVLVENRDRILRNLELVTIQKTLDEPVSIADVKRREPEVQGCADLFHKLALSALSRRAAKLFGIPSLAEQANHPSATRENLFEDAPRPDAGPAKTKAPDDHEDGRVGLTVVADADGSGCTIVEWSKAGSTQHHVDSMFNAPSAEIGTSEASMRYVYDHKAICHVLTPLGTRVRTPARDIMLAQYLLDPDQKAWGAERIGDAWHLSGDTSTPQGLAELVYHASYPIEAALSEAGLMKTLDDMEMPFSSVLASMEMAGLRTDTSYLREFGSDLGRRIADLERKAYDKVGTREYSLQSPKQLATLLFDVLGLAPLKKTKTGLSTDVESLEAIRDEHPVIPLILELRQLSKIKGTYTDSLVRYVGADGKIHPTFLQTGTSTGRISCVDPNLQNIPAKTEIGREIRRAFVPSREGWVLISADYSQIDLRMLAHLSGDPNLRQAFLDGEDIHLHTAAQVFEVPESAVTPEMRKRAKTINFGIIYGISPFGLARQLGVSAEDARKYIARYMQRFPGISEYHDRIVAAAERDGYVRTILGHLRRVPHITSHNSQERQEAVRQAFNAIVQGSSADAIKMAMIHLHQDLLPLHARMVLQVHDEIVVDAPAAELDSVRGLMKQAMENAIRLDIPLVANLASGPNLKDLS